MQNANVPELPSHTDVTFFAVVIFLYGFTLFALSNGLLHLGFTGRRIIRWLLIAGGAIAVWLTLLAILSEVGFFQDFSKIPPRIGLAVVPPVIAAIVLVRMKRFGELLVSLRPSTLIWPQAMRIFVEIFLWQAYIAQVVPVQMTFEGLNFDILTGVLAIPVSYIARHKLILAKVYNYLGLTLLLIVLTIALLSAPTPLRQFHNEPALKLPAEFPYIWLPGFIVPFAFALHLFSLRQIALLQRNSI